MAEFPGAQAGAAMAAIRAWASARREHRHYRPPQRTSNSSIPDEEYDAAKAALLTTGPLV